MVYLITVIFICIRFYIHHAHTVETFDTVKEEIAKWFLFYALPSVFT